MNKIKEFFKSVVVKPFLFIKTRIFKKNTNTNVKTMINLTAPECSGEHISSKEQSSNVLEEVEKEYNMTIDSTIKNFINTKGGMEYYKNIVAENGNIYEVDGILSTDRHHKYLSIEIPLKHYLSVTNKTMIPVAVDQLRCYFCVNNNTNEVYYFNRLNNEKIKVFKNLNAFQKAFIFHKISN